MILKHLGKAQHRHVNSLNKRQWIRRCSQAILNPLRGCPCLPAAIEISEQWTKPAWRLREYSRPRFPILQWFIIETIIVAAFEMRCIEGKSCHTSSTGSTRNSVRANVDRVSSGQTRQIREEKLKVTGQSGGRSNPKAVARPDQPVLHA